MAGGAAATGSPPALFVTDLDGTLLASDGRLSAWTRGALADLLGRGCPLTYATARSHHTAGPLLAGLPWRIPAIVSGGAFLVEPQDGRVLESRLLSTATAAAAIAGGQRLGLAPFLIGFSGNEERIFHLPAQNPGQAAFLGARQARGDPRLRCMATLPLPPRIVELHFMADQAAVASLARVLNHELCGQAAMVIMEDVHHPGWFSLELSHPRATKGDMLLALADHVGVSPRSAAVFGDNLNDLGMFAVAGWRSVCNAHPQVRAAADRVLAGNDADGVAAYLLDTWPTTPA